MIATTTTTTTTTEHRAVTAARAAGYRARHCSPYHQMQRPANAARAREQLSERLNGERSRSRADRTLDEQQAEREAVRAARADRAAAAAAATVQQRAARILPSEELLTAQRRDQCRSALSFPMTPDELLAAAMLALHDARLPDDDDRAETLSALLLHVVERHGPEPLRCDVGREWLRQRAHGIYLDTLRKRERSTGMRESARTLKDWQTDTDDDDRGERDPIMYLAANTAAPELLTEWTAAEIVERLELSGKQAGALVRVLDSEQRRTVPLSDAENMAASRARATLRQRYPDSVTFRLALHPDRVYGMAIAAAQRIMRQRAAVAGYGSHLPGQSVSMAEPMRPILRSSDQRLTRADRVWTYGLTARDDRAAR